MTISRSKAFASLPEASRPPAKDARINMRVEAERIEVWKEEAAKARLNLSEWIIQRVERA